MFDFLNNWSLPKKLWAAFSIINLMIAAVGINGYLTTTELTEISNEHVNRGIAGANALSDIISEAKEQRLLVFNYYAAVNAQELANFRERYKASQQRMDAAINTYSQVAGDDLASDVALLRKNYETLKAVNDRTLQLRDAGNFDAMMTAVKNEAKAASVAVTDQTNGLMRRSRERSDESAKAGAATSDTALALTVTLALTTMGLIVLIWLLINRSVAAPMSRIAHITTSLAEGGHEDVPYRDRQDEIGEIAEAVEQFRVAAQARAEIDARNAREQEIVTNDPAREPPGDQRGRSHPVDQHRFPARLCRAEGQLQHRRRRPARPDRCGDRKHPRHSHRLQRNRPRLRKISPAAPKAMRRALRKPRPRSPRWTTVCAPLPLLPAVPCSVPTGR